LQIETYCTAETRAKRIPGEPGLWILIAGDWLIFNLIFVSYAAYRSSSSVLYHESQQRLNAFLGLANTLILLTSSWFVVRAVESIRHDRNATAARWLAASAACGVAFIALKAIEYGEKFLGGITPVTNEFFTYYFAMTGIHLVHVIIGIAVLIWMRNDIVRDDKRANIDLIEGGACFWHFVDIIWIVLFSLLYIIR